MEPGSMPYSSDRVDPPHFLALIGTGGVGAGSFFAIECNTTLGREESRGGYFLKRSDYCKLHIISHYVKALLGPEFAVIPASKIGDDRYGQTLLAEMKAAGLDTRYIRVSPGDATLFSFCFTYPDGSGGNLTTLDAATAKVDPAFISGLEAEFTRWEGAGIALAVPEVPLAARRKLLELASAHRFFRAVSLTSEEARSEGIDAMLAQTDLLALNLEEAAALADYPSVGWPPEKILAALQQRVDQVRPGLLLSVTAGKTGSWFGDGSNYSFLPGMPVEAAGTAGAGDAHLSGLLAGLACRLPLLAAHQLGRLAAAFSVTSPDTIQKGLNRNSLLNFAEKYPDPIDPLLEQFLETGMRPGS